MKKTVFIISLSFILISPKLIRAQFIVDAGHDTVLCQEDIYGSIPILLGGDPVASGGSGNYTYLWETSVQIGSQIFEADYFLDDVSAEHPRLIEGVDELSFYLTVTDDQQKVRYDTINIKVNRYNYSLEEKIEYLKVGDSVQLYTSTFSNLALSETYSWTPSAGLTDSTKLNTYAKASVPITYYLTITNSAGCVASDQFEIRIIPTTGLNTKNAPLDFKVYLNPVNEQAVIKCYNLNGAFYTLELFDVFGKRILQEENNASEDYFIYYNNLPKGIYFVTVTTKIGEKTEKLILY